MAIINTPVSASEHSQQPSSKAPHDGEYVGMIEVVVLRCHPVSAHADAGKAPEPQSRPSKTATVSMPAGIFSKVATSLPLSDDSSASSETSGPFIGMFDGAGDEALREGTIMPFGGDAGWDNPLPQKSRGVQKSGASSARPDETVNKPVNEGSGSGSATGSVLNSQWHGRNQSRCHFNQDWSQSGRPSSQISQSRNSPQTQAQGKGGGATGKEAASRSVSGSKLSAPGNAGEPVRSGPTVQGTPTVVMNTNQADLLPGRWGVRPASSAVSEVDSWATRRTPFDYGEETCRASQEPRESRRPNTSWQAPAAWSEGSRGGQPLDDKKEFAKGSANNISLANLPTYSDANNAGNKALVRKSILLGTLVNNASLTASRRISHRTLSIPTQLGADGQSQPML